MSRMREREVPGEREESKEILFMSKRSFWHKGLGFEITQPE